MSFWRRPLILALASPAIAGSLRADPPDPPGVPTVVGLSMLFQDISQLNDVEQTITADVYVIARWRDPRLADPGRGDGSADCPVPGDELWKPVIEPENLRSRTQFYDPRFSYRPARHYHNRTAANRAVANPLDLHDFPFDSHLFSDYPLAGALSGG